MTMQFCGFAESNLPKWKKAGGESPLRQRRLSVLRTLMLAVFAAGLAAMPHGAAQAQAIALVVNGDPVTTLDVEQRMKLLRVLRRPATREAAIESMITDRLKYRESTHYGITINDNEIGEAVNIDAGKLKITAQQLLGEIQGAGIQKDHFLGYFKAELGFYVLVKALNKGVEASEIAVRAELAKEGGKNGITQYTVRQIVFTLDPGDSPAVVATRAKEAEGLRGRFSSCGEGIAYAKTLPGVAVREEFSRTSTSLPGPLKELLDKTPIGHVTPPSRTASGIELIAVCARGAPKDDTDLRKAISDRLIQAHLESDMAARLKELRSRAVIEKR
jgi:peptidyl-prolyl cis-trans isomerase SurA